MRSGSANVWILTFREAYEPEREAEIPASEISDRCVSVKPFGKGTSSTITVVCRWTSRREMKNYLSSNVRDLSSTGAQISSRERRKGWRSFLKAEGEKPVTALNWADKWATLE